MINEDRKIRNQFERMEKRKQKVYTLVTPLSEEMYLFQPSNTSWSVGQVANHLYLSEAASFAYLKKKMSYPDTIPSYSIQSWRAYYLTKFILLSPIKVKAPPAIDMGTDKPVLPPQQLDGKWNELRTELKSFIDGHYPQFRSKLVYNHPFAGRMTMLQMLMFFNDHLDHHIRQMKKIMRAVGQISNQQERKE
ncbi:MAG: DinB family protein [Saprospiraceae bacterium]